MHTEPLRVLASSDLRPNGLKYQINGVHTPPVSDVLAKGGGGYETVVPSLPNFDSWLPCNKTLADEWLWGWPGDGN